MFPLNESQVMGLDLDKHIAIDAGAGTGKTTVMAERYIQHLLSQYQRAKKLLPNGPRSPIQGQGSLRAPARERTSMVEWKGLLPKEVVAITFTRKAAAELRSRIRARLGKTDIDLHLISSGDIEMLLTNLEDAPISTIDAFLARLVTPYLDILSPQPAGDQISEVRSPMLISEAINSAWRIRTPIDAQEAGVRGNIANFIDSRNNLAVLLGGQKNAEIVLSGLLNTSLFVEETKRSLKDKSKLKGINWNEGLPVHPDIILDMISNPAESFIGGLIDNLRPLLNSYIDLYMNHYESFILDFEIQIGTNETRFNQLVELVRNMPLENKIEKLQWVWLIAICCTSNSSLNNTSPNHFPRNKLPNSDGWHAGMHTSMSKISGISKAKKAVINESSSELINQIKVVLNSNFGRLAKLLGQSSYTFSPLIEMAYLPDDSILNYEVLTKDLPINPPNGKLRISQELQLEVLKDLLVVHKGCQEILTLRKMQEGVHDFDDIQRLAADLLLARCPDIIRYEYPPEIVDILDNISDEPWSDSHLANVRAIIHRYPEIEEDFELRVSIVQTIRKQFLAFIIDEYQDTNPAHFRLLARLWGPRSERDESNYHGPWDPTICIVGDMKQSIYRFRQAEVTVMRRTVESIKQVNKIEFDNTKFEFRDITKGRDPRPIAGQDSFNHGVKLFDLPKNPKPWNHVEIYADENGVPVSEEHKESRRLGHIDLTSNHRTEHNLLRTLNGLFNDVFDPRHHKLPGDWHAKPQELLPKKQESTAGKLEWLLPLRTPQSQSKNSVFADQNSKTVHLEHEMIALRLQNLIQGKPCKIWNPSKLKFTTLEVPTDVINPSDITILIHSRKHIADLIERLQSRGIPVISDRQGQLLSQPIIKCLMSALDLIAHPKSKYAAVSLARTPIIGMTDSQIHTLFNDNEESENWWNELANSINNEKTSSLISYLSKQIAGNNVHKILNQILDNSDLLYAYPSDSSRQNSELWCNLVNDIGNDCGHNPAEIFAQMQALEQLGRKGPQAIATPSSGAVKIMTVHGAKGLQSKVVVVAGLFQAGQYDSSITARDNVLVTPEIISGRINPWASIDGLDDGLWQFAKNIDGAQSQAERRREFYVALTRVESHLIIVGNSTNDGALSDKTGNLQFNSKPSKRTMGHMWIEGLRALAHHNKISNSVWLKDGDQFGYQLLDYDEQTMDLDPYSLYFDSQLGGENINSLPIYHSPECFIEESSISPEQRWDMMERLIDNGQQKTPLQNIQSSVTHRIRLGANILDNSVKCRHNHWPNNFTNWNSNRVKEVTDQTFLSENTGKWFPSAIEFGLMMHRLVEISLDNPSKYHKSSAFALPKSWQNQPELNLVDIETVDIVLGEFGFSKHDKTASDFYSRARNRMHQVAKIIDKGLTGRYAKGHEINGRKAHGLRTELPFLYNHRIELENISRNTFRDCQIDATTNVSNAEIIFEGRADLVMAFVDDNHNSHLQVIDMKTTGCLYGFDYENPALGTALQQVSGDVWNCYPSSDSEREILSKYCYQLTLYSMALEAIEAEKPIASRRNVLPPAILIAASGKTVEMTENEYNDYKQKLQKHLEWIGELAAQPNSQMDPSRMSFAHAMTCWNRGINED